jgi:hypothetical protein
MLETEKNLKTPLLGKYIKENKKKKPQKTKKPTGLGF